MIPDLIKSLFAPVAAIFQKREERKMAREAANAALAQAKVQNAQTLELNKDQWEQLQVQGMGQTWKDEYVTVSVVSIVNLVVVGGVLAAFGHPEMLEGLGIALSALGAQGIDMGFLIEAAVLAGLGLSIWKRF
jgi:hypothetical protein